MHTKLLQMTKNPSMDNALQQYIVMYVCCIDYFNSSIGGWSIQRLSSGFASV